MKTDGRQAKTRSTSRRPAFTGALVRREGPGGIKKYHLGVVCSDEWKGRSCYWCWRSQENDILLLPFALSLFPEGKCALSRLWRQTSSFFTAADGRCFPRQKKVSLRESKRLRIRQTEATKLRLSREHADQPSLRHVASRTRGSDTRWNISQNKWIYCSHPSDKNKTKFA